MQFSEVLEKINPEGCCPVGGCGLGVRCLGTWAGN
jgi:hypothetical protein